MSSAMDCVQGWLRERFPSHRYIYFGLSGITMLYDALRSQPRRLMVLPGFLCPNISAAACQAGMQVIHVDADEGTQLPDLAQLFAIVAGLDASDTVVLIDHSFGYPFPAILRLRRELPRLFIIEDVARALGARVNGQLPGEHADWIIFSMYKTIAGSSNGAVLLSKEPILLSNGNQARTTLRERMARTEPFRSMYRALQRRTAEKYKPRSEELALTFPAWVPRHGFPSSLCMSRFATELVSLDRQSAIRSAMAQQLSNDLSHAGIRSIRTAPSCEAAGQFVSFRVPAKHQRDNVLNRLREKGLYVGRSWDIVSAHYRTFQTTFPAGYCNSKYLAEQMVHVRMSLFSQTKQRYLLVKELRKMLDEIPDDPSMPAFTDTLGPPAGASHDSIAAP